MIHLTLSEDAALVLFDLLARGECESLPFADQAEQRVLWDLEAALEREHVATLSPEYATRLAAARARLRDRTD